MWSKIGHIQSSRSRPKNLVESTLTEIWLIKPWPKCGHIWSSRLWPKFGRIRQNWPWSKFSRIQSIKSRLKFCQVDLSPNLVTSSPTEIRSKVIQVHLMLKFGLVGLDKKSTKFYGVSPIENLIYIHFGSKKWMWIQICVHRANTKEFDRFCQILPNFIQDQLGQISIGTDLIEFGLIWPNFV